MGGASLRAFEELTALIDKGYPELRSEWIQFDTRLSSLTRLAISQTWLDEHGLAEYRKTKGADFGYIPIVEDEKKVAAVLKEGTEELDDVQSHVPEIRLYKKSRKDLKPTQDAFFTNTKIQEFLQRRHIQEQDRPLLKELSELPKNILILHHNTFSFARENSLQDLQKEKGRIPPNSRGLDGTTEQRLRYCDIMIEIVQKYEWFTAHDLNRTLEAL
ncbi:MAG: hypothetical protein ABIO72_05615 [Patescibacteria group bacterium]